VVGGQTEETLLRTVQLESLRARETEIGQVDPVSVGEDVAEMRVEWAMPAERMCLTARSSC